jgi:hypothetical protein
VGLIAVHPRGIDILDLPPPHLPQLALAQIVSRQFATSAALTTTFLYNQPTHYLSVAVALRGQGEG